MSSNFQRRNQLEQLNKGVYASHPLQWGLLGAGGNATFTVKAFDKNGNQLPFYTGSADNPTLTRSDGSTTDGVLLVDMSLNGNGDFNGLVYHMLTYGTTTNDWPCPDTSVPGLPEGTVALEITLVTADSTGSLIFAPYGWDMERDPIIQRANGTNYDPITQSEWYASAGISPSHPSGLVPRNDGTEVYRLDIPGDSITIGWGTETKRSLPSEINAISSFSANAGSASDKTLDARMYANGGILLISATAGAGAGTLTVELFPVSADGTAYTDNSLGLSAVLTTGGAAAKRFSLEVPNGNWIVRFTAVTVNYTLVSAKFTPYLS